MYLVTIQMNVFGDNTDEEGSLGNIQVLMIAISGKYIDYVKEIQSSRKLGYPAYRIASEGSPTLVFTYEHKVVCLGADHQGATRANITSSKESALSRILERR